MMPAVDRQADSSGTTKRALKRRVLRGAVGLLLILAALAVVFLAVNLTGDQPGPPLYTAADLSEAPPAEINGWAMLRNVRLARDESVEAARKLAAKALITEVSATEFAAQRSARDRSLTTALDTCDAAFDQPRFADACPMDIETQCPHFVTFECQRLIAYRTLDLAAAGDTEEAVRLADRLLAKTIDHAQTGRGMLGQTVAQTNLSDAMTLIGVVARWLGREPAAPLLTRLRELDPGSLRPDLALVGEYVLNLRAIDHIRSSGGEDLPGWLLDEGATREILDDAYRRAAGGGAFEVPIQTEGLVWWVHNPAGKLLLDTMRIGKHVWRQIRTRHQEIRQRRQALLHSPR